MWILGSILCASQAGAADLPADRPVPDGIRVESIELLGHRPPPVPRLDLTTCTALVTAAPPTAPTVATDGQILFELRFRRGKVAAVTVARLDPGLDWLAPCLSRELAAVSWEIQRGRARVPVQVQLEAQPAAWGPIPGRRIRPPPEAAPDPSPADDDPQPEARPAPDP